MKTPSMLVGALFVALTATAARADTLKVPKQFDTIQAAVDAAVADDVIVVAKGHYAPFSVVGKTGLTIKGKGHPVIDGGGADAPIVVVDSCTSVVLRGLTVSNGADRGIEVTDCTDVLISKCRVDDVDGEGIYLTGDFHMVQKCRFENTGLEAIAIGDGSSDVWVDKSRFTDTASAITFRGDGHIATRNRIKDSQNEGFVIQGTNCDIEKNVFDGVVDDALDVEGDDNVFWKNKIRHVGSNGVEVEAGVAVPLDATGNLFVKNSVSKVLQNGYFAGAAGNTFVKNKAKQAGGLGLLDTAGPDANYYEKNHFGTKSFE
ncbi:MAG TPA: right-handed parallel beta-helix repeat-containing protein [Planctomycetota bacterium]|nr:right-handed parallel beta-helix repeat-containing protein [Planctomycetota bacterium]